MVDQTEAASSNDARMDADALYRESVITDRKVGTIRMLEPVKADGSADTERDTLFMGQASLYTPGGALPLNFELEAKTLADAVEAFADAANKAVEETMEKLKEMRREQASQLYVPGQGGGQGGPGGQGGGGIQMP
ncbi:MAG: hypothetical protein R3217_03955 [Gammaproteobacteria bacterium]|nr:hypothetical protein [Gammaproteobacteria bacterium]